MKPVNQDECFYPLWLIFFSVRILHQEPLGTLLNSRCGRIADELRTIMADGSALLQATKAGLWNGLRSYN